MSTTSAPRTGPWLAIALAGLAIAAFALALPGATRPTGVVAQPSSTEPIALASAAPSPGPTPRPTPGLSAAPVVPPLLRSYVNSVHGYWYTGAYESQPQPGTFATGCGPYICASYMRVWVADAEGGISGAIPAARGLVLRGGSTDDVRDLWLREIPDARVEPLIVDGQEGFLGFDETYDVWGFIVFDGRLYMFEPYGIAPDTAERVEAFVRGVHLIVPACWLSPCPPDVGSETDSVLSFDAAAAGGLWRERPANLIDANDPGAARVFNVGCDSRTCAGGLAITLGTTATGAPVISLKGGSPSIDNQVFGTAGSVRIRGTTLEELAASWDRMVGNAAFQPITIGGESGIVTKSAGVQTVLVVHAGYVVAVTTWGMIAFDPAPDVFFGWFAKGLAFVG